MLSEKLMTMMSGVITLRKIFRLKFSQPERAERKKNRHQWWSRGDDHERHPPKEQNGDHTADRKTKRVVDQPVALDCVTNFQLHNWNADSSALRPVPAMLFLQLADSPMMGESLPGPVASGLSDSTIKVSLPSGDNILPRMISFDLRA